MPKGNMWEIIRTNKRKSIFLFVAMGLCLLVLGYFIGNVFFPPNGGINGIIIAVCVWLVMSLVSYTSGDAILLSLSKAQEVSHDVHPQLFNIVEEMKIASGAEYMPKIYIIPDPAPNAFATGIKPEKTAIAVTAGLLSRLNRDELQGVIAHEMSHIINRDVLFMSFAGILLGSIVLISEVFLRSMWFSSGSSRRYKSGSAKGGGQAQLIILVAAIVMAILSPIIARILYFAMSRKREYLADASAVRLTRYPEGLASALERISSSGIKNETVNKVTAPLYIINPLKQTSMGLSDVSSTHPPISERVKILRGMQQGVSFQNYSKSLAATRGASARGIMPGSAARDSEYIAIRKASDLKSKKADRKKKTRDVGDLIRAVNNYVFISCLCGLKIKVPPNFKKPKLSCPKCGKEHDVPLMQAELAGVSAAISGLGKDGTKTSGTQTASGEPAVYTKKGEGWESFSCKCGKPMQISPLFEGAHLSCKICGRKTLIK